MVDYTEYATNKIADWFEEIHNLVVDVVEYRDTDWIVSQLIEHQEIDVNIFLSYCKTRDIEMVGWNGGFEMLFPQNTFFFQDYLVKNGKIFFENLVSIEYVENKIIERMKQGNFSAYIVSYGVYCSGRDQWYEKNETIVIAKNGNVNITNHTQEYNCCENMELQPRNDFDIYIEKRENYCGFEEVSSFAKIGDYEVEFPEEVEIPTDELYYICNFSASVEKFGNIKIVRNNDGEITHVVIRDYIFTSEKSHDIFLEKKHLEVLQSAFGFSYIVRNFTVTNKTCFYTSRLAEIDGKALSPSEAFKTVVLDQEKDTHGNDVILHRSYIYFGIENDDFNVLPIVYLQVVCPSTGNIHFLPVPPDTKTCREGLAFTFQVKNYYPEIES